jgi:hypothetical protein
MHDGPCALPAPERYLRKQKAKQPTVKVTCGPQTNQASGPAHEFQTSSAQDKKCLISLTDPYDLLFDAAINADIGECNYGYDAGKFRLDICDLNE